MNLQSAEVTSESQSWALAVIFNFYIVKNAFFFVFNIVNLIGGKDILSGLAQK